MTNTIKDGYWSRITRTLGAGFAFSAQILFYPGDNLYKLA